MEKKLRGIRKFFAEFKTFITRGNVVDLAVGVIIGGAFTAVVNGLSNYILKPLIDMLLALILGGEGLTDVVTFLKKVETVGEDGVTPVIDMANSIYIDWGAFIVTIINFLLVAFTLFLIVHIINKTHEAKERATAGLALDEKKEIRRIRKAQNVSKAEAKRVYEEEVAAATAAKAEEERLAAEKAAEEARIAEEKATANTKLLEEIRDLLKQK